MSIRRGLPELRGLKSRALKQETVSLAEPPRSERPLDIFEFRDIIRKFVPRETVEKLIAELDEKMRNLQKELESIKSRIAELEREYERKKTELSGLRREKRQYELLLHMLLGDDKAWPSGNK